MSNSCTHNCSTCGSSCGANKPESLIKSTHARAKVKKVIAVVSGKGGVGKSAVCAMLAAMANKKGYKTAILDADITGPSQPKLFGVTEKAMGVEDGILPVVTDSGIQMMSMNLLLDEDTTPVLWRGSLIAGAATQFWTDVVWEDVDYMFVDMPPGTGDVPLSIFQSLPLSGIVMVTAPQELVGMIVQKALVMADKMNIPVLGLVENMSYYVCPCCGKESDIFGASKAAAVAAENGIPSVARLPIDPAFTALADQGKVEEYEKISALEKVFAQIEKSAVKK